jgi:hypothetical protein
MTHSRAIASIALILVTALAAISRSDELEELQGVWESRFQHGERSLRVVKTIEGDVDTVETYDGKELVHRHVCKFELVEAEGMFVYKWGQSDVTDGPGKGAKGKPGQCVSKRLGDTWYHVFGLRGDEKYPPRVETYTRVEKKKK